MCIHTKRSDDVRGRVSTGSSAAASLQRLLRSSCHTSDTLDGRPNKDAPFALLTCDHAWQHEPVARAHWKRPCQLAWLCGSCSALLAGKDRCRVCVWVCPRRLLIWREQRSYASDYVGLAILVAGYILVRGTTPQSRDEDQLT
jgi:hypothetical protein